MGYMTSIQGKVNESIFTLPGMSDEITVKDVMRIITKKAATVREDSTLKSVLKEMVKDPKTQNVYVVNEKNQLTGIITINIALQYLYSDYIPPRYLEFDTTLLAGENTIAKDIMLPAVYVKENDKIQDAFVKMFQYHLYEIPVVDDEMHITGDLHAMELIVKRIEW